MTFSLFPGQAHDAPEGRKLLHRLGRQRENPSVVMDRSLPGQPDTPTSLGARVHTRGSTSQDPA